MIAIQACDAVDNYSRGSVQRRSRHEKRDSLEQIAILLSVTEGALFRLEIIKGRQTLQVVTQMPL